MRVSDTSFILEANMKTHQHVVSYGGELRGWQGRESNGKQVCHGRSAQVRGVQGVHGGVSGEALRAGRHTCVEVERGRLQRDDVTRGMPPLCRRSVCGCVPHAGALQGWRPSRRAHGALHRMRQLRHGMSVRRGAHRVGLWYA